MKKLAAVVVIVFALAPAACGGSKANTSTLDVVTAFYPLELVATRIGGDAVAVTNLTAPGSEPHDLELKPSDVRRIKDADLILYLADGFQPALEDVIRTFSDRSIAVDLLDGLPLKPPPAGSEEEEEPSDPHVWLSPQLLERIADSAATALARRLPDGSGEIQTRARALKDELQKLDGEFQGALKTCKRREIFTSHAAFAYLADRYSLRQVPLTGLSPEAEPTSKHLQDVARRARAAGATTIFFETLVSPRVAESVARIVGAKTAVLDPIEGLTSETSAAGADYFSVMRENLAALVKALDCTS